MQTKTKQKKLILDDLVEAIVAGHNKLLFVDKTTYDVLEKDLDFKNKDTNLIACLQHDVAFNDQLIKSFILLNHNNLDVAKINTSDLDFSIFLFKSKLEELDIMWLYYDFIFDKVKNLLKKWCIDNNLGFDTQDKISAYYRYKKYLLKVNNDYKNVHAINLRQVLIMDENSSYDFLFDVVTNEVIVRTSDSCYIDEDEDIELDDDEYLSDRYIYLAQIEPNDDFTIMKEFAYSVTNKEIQERLLDALDDYKPFRAFKNEIRNLKITDAFYRFQEKEYFVLTREWCIDNKIKYIDDETCHDY